VPILKNPLAITVERTGDVDLTVELLGRLALLGRDTLPFPLLRLWVRARGVLGTVGIARVVSLGASLVLGAIGV
jgi:hypothetical protein